MEEPYIEGVAIRGGPESCVGAREGGGEALTGVARPGFPARCARRGRSRSQSSRADAVAPVLVLGTMSDNGRVKPVGVRNQLGAGPPA